LKDLYDLYFLQAAVEPMQVDTAPEENDNIEDVQYIVEATSLVILNT
jgi:hypothetical protein